MLKSLLTLLTGAMLSSAAFAQTLYFPPTTGTTWDTLPASQLQWCNDRIDSLYQFLERKNTKGFIILKDGKRVLEHYVGTFTRDSSWYWASAGKSLKSFLVGQAQERGFINIHNKTSDYLGQGWTSCTTAQEDSITLWHQLTMTTGLDDGIANSDCYADTCLLYKATAGTRWAYHNAPYTVLSSVLETATNKTINQLTNQWIETSTGMSGTWFMSSDNEVYYSKVRDAARYGLLVLNRGIWNTDTLLHDTAYYRQMTNTSQNINRSYGYLWWLNGKGQCMVPSLQISFPTDLVPNAPDDMFAALGKNDQKIYVVPSQKLVVVRMGDAADNTAAALTDFDNELWDYINQLQCTTTATHISSEVAPHIYPNPATETLTLHVANAHQYSIYNALGQLQTAGEANGIITLSVADWQADIYYAIIRTAHGQTAHSWIKK